VVETSANAGDDTVVSALEQGDGLDPLRAEQALERVRGRLFEHETKPVALGRYVVLMRLGAGGAGIVYAAYDPELDRRVAIKVVRPGPAGSTSRSDARAALLNEARAIARLAHPNVVAVFDVDTGPTRVLGEEGGADGDAVFIVMELVDGMTLHQWVREEERSWRDVVDVFLQAGRGLAAAHAAGIVHRDFKPGNVLIGEDGRARVLDFGLAQAAPTGAGKSLDHLDSSEPDSHAAGTPAYMAPEQHRAVDVDPRTDQYSFCLALYEGLYKARPFSQSRMNALAEAKESPPERAPTVADVPRWLFRIVRRGLSPLPADRYPSMRALLAELDNDPARRRKTAAIVGASVLVVAAIAAGAFLPGERVRQACVKEGAAIEDVWNDEARSALRQSVRASGMGFADVTADKVMPWLDDHAEAWKRARTQVCLDTQLEHRWSEALHDQAVRCLDERKMEFRSKVNRLISAEARVADKAVTVAAGLRAVEPCLDQDRLRRVPAPPSERLDEVQRVRAQINEARALAAVAAYDEGLALAREAHESAFAVGWPPLTAAARQMVGIILDQQGAYEEAARELEAAYFEAVRGGADEVAVRTAHNLMTTVGIRLNRTEQGFRWSRHAEALMEGVPDRGGLLEASQLGTLAGLHFRAGEFEEAEQLQRQALELTENALGPHHPQLGRKLANLAILHINTDDYDQALVLQQRALGIFEQALGPGHPATGQMIRDIGITYFFKDDLSEAKSLYEQALTIQTQALGETHPDLAVTLHNLAAVFLQLGDFSAAAEHGARALALREPALGPDDPKIALDLHLLARAKLGLGSTDEARDFALRAQSIREKAFSEGHPETVKTRELLAKIDATRAEGAPAAARTEEN
jgi:tetratricopeptide (TPR) repeat protein